MREIDEPVFNPDDYVVAVEQGGTGATTLAQAALNLKLVTNDQIGQPLGPIPLDANGKVSSSLIPDISGTNRVNLQGNFFVVTNDVVSWTITDYDSFKTYALSASSGTISRVGNIVTYSAPATVGAVTIAINGRSFVLNVQSSQPAQPSVTSPTNGASNVFIGTQLTSSAFAYKGVADTHASSDWQISSDTNFGTIVASVTNDATNKTTWTPGGLPVNTRLYVRVRHKGASGVYSQWSSISYFDSQVLSIISTEEAKLVASDKIANSGFGLVVAISSDGTRVVAGAYGATSGGLTVAGQAYVFLRTGNSWAQEQILFASDRIASARFGWCVGMSGDATRCIVGAIYATSGGFTSAGQAYVYLRTGTTWAQEAILFASDRAANWTFGYWTTMSNDGTRCISGAYNATSGGFTAAGQAYVFLRTGTTWAQEAILSGSDKNTSGLFGGSAAMNADATRCIIGGWQITSNSITNAGEAFVFVRNGTVWTQEAVLYAPDRATNAYFGISVLMSADATRCLVGAFQASSGSFAAAGQVYVFLRTGVSWALEAVLYASDRAASAWFGLGVSGNSDFSRIIVGARQATSGGVSQAGQAYSFGRSGTVWSQESILSASDRATGGPANFGCHSAGASDGSRFVIGAQTSNQGGTTAAGAIYIER